MARTHTYINQQSKRVKKQYRTTPEFLPSLTMSGDREEFDLDVDGSTDDGSDSELSRQLQSLGIDDQIPVPVVVPGERATVREFEKVELIYFEPVCDTYIQYYRIGLPRPSNPSLRAYPPPTNSSS